MCSGALLGTTALWYLTYLKNGATSPPRPPETVEDHSDPLTIGGAGETTRSHSKNDKNERKNQMKRVVIFLGAMLLAAVLLPVAASGTTYSFSLGPPNTAENFLSRTIRVTGSGTFDTGA